jgi:hypothetical protein
MPEKPPFSAEVSISTASTMPASFRDEHYTPCNPTANIFSFLQEDLSCKRLNKVHKYLWLAGRPMPPRPLNYQVATSREIVSDERIDMHMVWENSRRLHLKPIPRYLLNHLFWDSHLICTELRHCVSENGERSGAPGVEICLRKELYEYGFGFLFSYIALVQYESDFAIAQDLHLLPKDVKWGEWVRLVQQLMENGAANPKNVNARYLFGELRLSRLNKIYAIRFGNVLRGYQFPHQTYGELFHSYFAPLTATTIYVALVLTAMQVGLATKRLSGNLPFQRASYGFTVFSILSPLIVALLVGLIGLLQFINNLVVTWRFRQKRFEYYALLRSQSP